MANGKPPQVAREVSNGDVDPEQILRVWFRLLVMDTLVP